MIGLMTPFRVNNYGTKLQAYALQQYVGSLGYDAEIINYVPVREPTTLRNFPRKCFYRMIRLRYADYRAGKSGPADVEACREVRRRAIEAFDGNYLKLSEKMDSHRALCACSDRYSAVLSGSDQVFNPVNLGAGCYYLEWTGGGVRKIAVSPSFGVDRIPAWLKSVYRRKLKRFDALSVREESGRRIMNTIGFEGAVRTLDPTFLPERAVWHEFADEAGQRIPSGYVLGYFLGERSLGRKALERLGEDRKIVLLPHIKGYVPEDDALNAEKLYDVGVPEFLNLIRGADCVVTDSFHAAAFSVMFHRPFYAVERHEEGRNSTNARLRDLLSMLGLENRMIHRAEDADGSAEIDYRIVDEILERERTNTERYIRTSLMGVD